MHLGNHKMTGRRTYEELQGYVYMLNMMAHVLSRTYSGPVERKFEFRDVEYNAHMSEVGDEGDIGRKSITVADADGVVISEFKVKRQSDGTYRVDHADPQQIALNITMFKDKRKPRYTRAPTVSAPALGVPDASETASVSERRRMFEQHGTVR